MIVIPASLSSAFIHMAGMTIHIALESTIHIAGIRIRERRPGPCLGTDEADAGCSLAGWPCDSSTEWHLITAVLIHTT
jgi:hypothetical protein